MRLGGSGSTVRMALSTCATSLPAKGWTSVSSSEGDAEAVDVAARVDAAAPAGGLLGADVGGRAEEVAAAGDRAIVAALGQAEVGELDAAALALEDQVAGLHVAVHDALGVRVGQGLGRVQREGGREAGVVAQVHHDALGAIRLVVRRAGQPPRAAAAGQVLLEVRAAHAHVAAAVDPGGLETV